MVLFRGLLLAHRLSDQMPAVVSDMLGSKGLMLRTGTVVDATLIAAPGATQTASGKRDPDMHQTKKGNQWSAVPKTLGMKAHIGVDAESGLVPTVKGTPANANDVTEANALLHGDETDAFACGRQPGRGQTTRCEKKRQLAHCHATRRACGAGQDPDARLLEM